MQQTEDVPTPDETSPPPEKNNLGAKIGVLGMGWFLAGKLSYPGAFIDASNLFPKDTRTAEKFKRTFSKEFWPLIKEAVALEKSKGHNAFVAWAKTTKWTLTIPTAIGIVLGAIGWRRADLIQDSKDIIQHPYQSAKIIFGLQPPEDISAKEAKGKHTTALVTQRASIPKAHIER